MKISTDTIQILKNLASINNSLFITEGNHIKSRSELENIHVEVTLAEEFPISCGIYDLSSLISMLTLFSNSEVEFGDEYLSITNDSNEFRFFYADPEVVKEVQNSIPNYETIFECQLLSSDITTINKTLSILKAPSISFIGDGNDVHLVVGDETKSATNSYRKHIGESEHKFAYHIDKQTFKLIEDDYKVNVSKHPQFVHFASESKDLDYVLAIKKTSTYN